MIGPTVASVSWETISSLATAAGTLVLAVATFSSVRSANRSARVAELSLMAGLRPVLVPSRPEHPAEWVNFADGYAVELSGGQASAEEVDGTIYLTMALHNVGSGIGVLHGWHVDPTRSVGDPGHADPDDFRRLSRDLYVPADYFGFWQGAVRDPDDPDREPLRRALEAGDPITLDLLYGDQEGGQRMITRFRLLAEVGVGEARTSGDPKIRQPTVTRHWNLDRPDPR